MCLDSLCSYKRDCHTSLVANYRRCLNLTCERDNQCVSQICHNKRCQVDRTEPNPNGEPDKFGWILIAIAVSVVLIGIGAFFIRRYYKHKEL